MAMAKLKVFAAFLLLSSTFADAQDPSGDDPIQALRGELLKAETKANTRKTAFEETEKDLQKAKKKLQNAVSRRKKGVEKVSTLANDVIKAQAEEQRAEKELRQLRSDMDEEQQQANVKRERKLRKEIEASLKGEKKLQDRLTKVQRAYTIAQDQLDRRDAQLSSAESLLAVAQESETSAKTLEEEAQNRFQEKLKSWQLRKMDVAATKAAEDGAQVRLDVAKKTADDSTKRAELSKGASDLAGKKVRTAVSTASKADGHFQARRSEEAQLTRKVNSGAKMVEKAKIALGDKELEARNTQGAADRLEVAAKEMAAKANQAQVAVALQLAQAQVTQSSSRAKDIQAKLEAAGGKGLADAATNAQQAYDKASEDLAKSTADKSLARKALSDAANEANSARQAMSVAVDAKKLAELDALHPPLGLALPKIMEALKGGGSSSDEKPAQA